MSNINPYEVPKSSLTVETEPQHYGDASRGQRFLNFIIDMVGQNACIYVAVFILARLGKVTAGQSLLINVFALSVGLLYYVVLEYTTGRTLGKLATGTMVVSRDERDLTLVRIVGRSLARFLPFEPFSFLGDEPGGWHDRMSGTRVVRLRRPSGYVREQAPDVVSEN